MSPKRKHSASTGEASSAQVQEKTLPELVIALHIGAGDHSARREQQYRDLMTRAGQGVLKNYRQRGVDQWPAEPPNDPAIQAEWENILVEIAMNTMEVLEDNQLVNAGAHGGNLNWDGQVECDASILTPGVGFAAVTALPNIRYPSRVAQGLWRRRKDWLYPWGSDNPHQPLVPPVIVSGKAGLDYLHRIKDIPVRTNPAAAPPPTPGSRVQEVQPTRGDNRYRRYLQYKDAITQGATSPSTTDRQNTQSQKRTDSIDTADDDDSDGGTLLDTCGVIVALPEYALCCVVCSSGGLWLKQPGRVGPCAIRGAGSAIAVPQDTSVSDGDGSGSGSDHRLSSGMVAVCASGTGETMINDMTAFTAAQRVMTGDCMPLTRSSELGHSGHTSVAGVLYLVIEDAADKDHSGTAAVSGDLPAHTVHYGLCHSSRSMAYGVFTSQQGVVLVDVSRQLQTGNLLLREGTLTRPIPTRSPPDAPKRKRFKVR